MKKKANAFRSILDIERFKTINGQLYAIPPIICDDHIYNSSQLKHGFYYYLYVITDYGLISDRLIKFLNYRQNKYNGNIEALFFDIATEKNLSIDLIALGLESYEGAYVLNAYLKLSPVG